MRSWASTHPAQIADVVRHNPHYDGVVVTADAEYPNRDSAAYITARHGHYVFTVKGNRPALLNAIAARLPAATTASTCPAAAWVFRVRRDAFDLHGYRVSMEYVHGITSLPAVSTAMIACHVRGHWGIENKIHWVRDVLFAEDRHHARIGGVAHTMATIRNLVIGLIRLAGHTRIKQVLERNHGDKTSVLTLLAAPQPKIN